MGMMGGMFADRHIERVQAAGSVDSPKAAKAVEKLRKIGVPAVEHVIAAIGEADRQQMGLLVELLSRLISGKTLAAVAKGLADDSNKAVKGVAWALTSSTAYNPNQLLDVLAADDVPKGALCEVLAAHRDRLDPRRLLTAAYGLESTEKATLFRIVKEIADESLVPDLISRMSGKDTAAKVHIIDVLSRFNTEAVHEALEGQLESESKMVRQAAITALGEMDGDIRIDLLCRLLRDADIDVQNRAVDVVIKQNHPDTMKHLIEVLKDENEYARRAAVEVLNEIGTTDSIKDLLGALEDDDWWVRARATDALANIGGPRVVDAVLSLIKDDDEDIRRSAIEILNSVRDERAVKHLIEATKDTDWWVRERAVDALAEIGSEKAIPAIAALLDGDVRTVPVAIRALAKLGARKTVKHLIPLLDRTERQIQVEAIKALGSMVDERNAETVRAKIHAYTASEDKTINEVASSAIRALDSKFSDTLIAAAQESDAQAEKFAQPERTLLMDSEEIEEVMEAAAGPQTLDITQLEEGDLIENRYRFIRKIGKGAFGTVLLMEDEVVGENLILKFLNPGVASDEEMMKRFVHELRYTRKITHRNVIRIYDFLHLGGLYAISMEYFDSHPLGDEIKDGEPMPLKKALKYTCDIATGMVVAHQAGIVHRDLKPANILINDDGLLKIVDFGVAAARSSGDTQLTKTGYVIGSPKYMAPEQILGKKVDEKADIYSLGVILYEMLTGVPPYSRGDHMSVMYQHVQGKAKTCIEINPKLPQELSDAVAQCMSVDRTRRYGSMEEVRSTFGRFFRVEA